MVNKPLLGQKYADKKGRSSSLPMSATMFPDFIKLYINTF